MRLHLIGVLAAIVILCPRLKADPIFSLSPPGAALSGGPGETVGWGFTLENSADYLVVTGVDFNTPSPVGSFTDFMSAFNFIVVGPENPIVTQAFDSTALTGVGSYLIDILAPPGALSPGHIQISYDLYSVDPNSSAFDPAVDLLSSGNSLEANASVQVRDPPASAPEPSTWTLLGSVAALLAALARKGVRKHRCLID